MTPDTASGQPTRSRQLHILVIDDEVDNAQALAMVMRLEGFDVTVATSAATALAAAATQPFDALLIDIAMPGMDGYELARRLRGLCPVTLLVIAITGYGQQQDRERSRSEGFDYHFVKPTNIPELSDILRLHAGALGLTCAHQAPSLSGIL